MKVQSPVYICIKILVVRHACRDLFLKDPYKTLIDSYKIPTN